MTLATTVALPAVRGPAALAKSLGAIDVVSGGRVVIGVGPGSSARDYEAVGLDAEERWQRLDESIGAMRAFMHEGAAPHEGAFYSTAGLELEPRSPQSPGPPIWVGSWGSKSGVRRVARLADGWLASGYNTTPERFATGLERLGRELEERGRDPVTFPNGLATMWTYVADDPAEATKIVESVLSPLVRRSPEELAQLSLPVGVPDVCAERVVAFARAGVQRMFIWPLANPLDQLERFQSRVAPLVRELLAG